MIAARLALLLTVLVLAAPAAAVAQDNPFGPLPQSPTPQQDVQTTSNNNSNTTTGDSGGLKRWQEILIFLGGAILLTGIGWAIVADARKSAPVEETETVAASRAAREADRHRRKERARQKGKAARAARRQNR